MPIRDTTMDYDNDLEDEVKVIDVAEVLSIKSIDSDRQRSKIRISC